MKKLISLILTFVILLSTLTTSLATYGAVYSGMDEENIYFNNIVYHKGSLYSFINDSLFEYNDTDSNFVKIAELERTESMNGYISGLASDGDDLIYYDGSSLSFYKGAIDNGIIKLEPAYSFEKVDTGIEYFYTDKAVICDDFIYMLSFGMGQGASLYIIDKKTGQFSTKKFDENYTNIEGYKGNSIIFASGEKIKSFDGQNFTELFDIPKLDSIFGVSLVYNKAKDIILLVDENFVYSQQADGSFKKAAFTGMGFINGACAFDDNIALISDGKVYTYKLDSDNMPETFIRVYGTSTEVMRKYNEANPSLPAIAINSQYLATINDIASNMKSADACDVYVLNSSMGLKPLVERNYVVPLTMDGIKNSIDRMYPYIKEALLFDGVPYFYPIGVVSYGDISN
ncbi:MAG: hypothetical protein GYA87_01460, partial [Christensenellaceae bacterium]|nr:hypothetical protein [Christensenellaceae bacterium]